MQQTSLVGIHAALLLPWSIALLAMSVWYWFRATAPRELRWQLGEWTLIEQGVARGIRPVSRSVLLPRVIWFAYQTLPIGKVDGFWVLADSLDRDDYRRLRVRLRLSLAGRA